MLAVGLRVRAGAAQSEVRQPAAVAPPRPVAPAPELALPARVVSQPWAAKSALADRAEEKALLEPLLLVEPPVWVALPARLESPVWVELPVWVEVGQLRDRARLRALTTKVPRRLPCSREG